MLVVASVWSDLAWQNVDSSIYKKTLRSSPAIIHATTLTRTKQGDVLLTPINTALHTWKIDTNEIQGQNTNSDDLLSFHVRRKIRKHEFQAR